MLTSLLASSASTTPLPPCTQAWMSPDARYVPACAVLWWCLCAHAAWAPQRLRASCVSCHLMQQPGTGDDNAVLRYGKTAGFPAT
jgi:hypothetical protein